MIRSYFKNTCRPAFTLVELLVVIAIIGILIAMLLPAVQYVREAARKTSCSNKTRQHAIAMHNFESARGHFPSAYDGNANEPGWGWSTQIFSFIELDNFAETFDITSSFGGGLRSALPTDFSTTPLSVFRCPSDNAPDINKFHFNHATSNYRAVYGNIARFTSDGSRFVYEWRIDYGGVLRQNSRTEFKNITDGTSNVLLHGEMAYEEDGSKTGAIWAGMSGEHDGSRWTSDVMWPINADREQINGVSPWAFSSHHPGGALFSFADGSVRFFPNGGDVEMLQLLAVRNDGTHVEIDF